MRRARPRFVLSTRTLAVLALVLWLPVAGVVGWALLRSHAAPAPDGRTEIRLTAAEREFVLGQMRTMLATVKGVVNGMAIGDPRVVAGAARTSGGSMLQQPALRLKLPDTFRQLAQQLHAGFDAIAVAAEEGADTTRLNGLLNGQLALCVACHATYRFRVEAGP